MKQQPGTHQRFLLVVLLFLYAASLSPSAEAKRPRTPQVRITYAGFVMERGSRDPLEGAPVYLLGRKGKFNTVTDAKGYFSFANMRPGKYSLVIPVPNYKRFKLPVELKASTKPDDKGLRKIEESYFLVKVGAGLFESVTKARRKQQEINKQSLQGDEISIIPGTQGDPLKVVQNLPGVARTPLNTGFFIVRGSAPEDSRVFVDGHQIPQLYHFGGLTAVINGDLARSIDLLPGGFSVAYGRATGGIIEVKTRTAKNQWHGYLDLDIIDVGFLLEGPLWKGASVTLSARRSHIDAFLGLILPADNRAFDLTVAPRYYDYQVKLDWRINKRHFLSLTFYGSDDLLSFVRDVPIGRADIRGEFKLSSLFHRIQFLWELRPSNWISHDFSIHFGYSLNAGSAGSAITFDSSQWVLSLRDELRLKLHKKVTVRAGVDMRIRAIGLDLKIPLSFPREEDAPGSQGGDPIGQIGEVKRDYVVFEPALYAELDWQVVKPLRAIIGIRADYYNNINEFTFNPRGSLVWTTPHKPLSFKTSIGLFSQPPQLQESSADFGNPDVRAEHAMHYTLGPEYAFTPYLTASVTFYYKQLVNLVVSSKGTVIRDGKEVAERVRNGGIGSSYGVEMMLRHRPHGRFFGWISYTLGRSERTEDPLQPSRLFSYDQTHIFTLVAALKIGWGLTASARFRLVSGNPTTPTIGSIYDSDNLRYIPIPGPTNSARNPLFHQLDLRIDYKLTFTRWKLMFYLDVQNVYNFANQEGVTNNYDYTKQAPITGIPIIPSLGIKGEF